MEFTRKSAQRLIESKPVISEMLTPIKGIEVTNVGFKDKDGDAFTWEDGEEYAIVSFKAVSEYQFNQSVEQFEDEEYEEACNHNLSLSMEPEKARALIGAVGVLTCKRVENKDGEMITVVKSFKAIAPAEATTLLRTIGGKKDKKDKKIKLADADDDISIDDMRKALIEDGMSKKEVKALADKKVKKAYAEL